MSFILLVEYKGVKPQFDKNKNKGIDSNIFLIIVL
tara:strand:+ start:242 stop:346 length:105 start_codon:yes stop_codon:yes gene_type:complete